VSAVFDVCLCVCVCQGPHCKVPLRRCHHLQSESLCPRNKGGASWRRLAWVGGEREATLRTWVSIDLVLLFGGGGVERGGERETVREESARRV
jgi:hypothetical protein